MWGGLRSSDRTMWGGLSSTDRTMWGGLRSIASDRTMWEVLVLATQMVTKKIFCVGSV